MITEGPEGQWLATIHDESWSRLLRGLRGGRRFRLLILTFGDRSYRDQITRRLEEKLGDESVARIDIDPSLSPKSLEERMIAGAETAQYLFVEGFERLGIERDRWLESLNYAREHLSENCPASVLFWLHDADATALAGQAPDLWAWRSGVYEFSGNISGEERHGPALAAQSTEADTYQAITGATSARRLEELEAHLEAVSGDDASPSRAALLVEAGELSKHAGNLERALLHLKAAASDFDALKDEGERAKTAARQADVLRTRGQLDNALSILQQELPVFTRLGDVHSLAVTQGKIADILMARGDLDAALKIRQEQQLPVFTRLGDVRSLAVTQGQIADILMARGDLDAALKVRQEQELPVFTRLGDVRSLAVTQGRIADILMERGDLDAALKIRQEQELPVFTRLGDVRSLAVTQGKIADILMARGDLDAALKIRQEQQLPVFTRLGDVRSLALTQGQIADILMARGDLDAALKIRQEQQLPVFTRLGDVRALIVACVNVALLLLQRGREEDRPKAKSSLVWAHNEAQQRGYAEAPQIADILRQRGFDSDATDSE